MAGTYGLDSLRRGGRRRRFERHVQDVVSYGWHLEEGCVHGLVDFFWRDDRPRQFFVAFGVGRDFANRQVRVFLSGGREREFEGFVHGVELRRFGRVLDLHEQAIGFTNWNTRRLRFRVDLEREDVR